MSSYLTFSPLPDESGGYSLLRYSTLTDSFPLRSMVLCVARTFLTPEGERQTGKLQWDKGNSFNWQLKIENRDNHIKMVRYSSLLLFFQSNLFSTMSCIFSTLSCIFSALSYMFSTLSKINYIGIWWQFHGKHSAVLAVILLNVWPFVRQSIVKKVLCITQYC